MSQDVDSEIQKTPKHQLPLNIFKNVVTECLNPNNRSLLQRPLCKSMKKYGYLHFGYTLLINYNIQFL